MSNYERYQELCEKYRVTRREPQLVGKTLDDFDVVVHHVGTGYAHVKYAVLKNTVRLSTEDLAIICDEGNLPFGYRTQGGIIIVHTD